MDLSKRLILLTGPNNTGKTYLACSVYGLYRTPSAPKTLRPVFEEILTSPTQSIGIERIHEVWPSILDEAGRRIADQVHRCFGVSKAFFSDVSVTLRPGSKELQSFMTQSHSQLLPQGVLRMRAAERHIALQLESHTDMDGQTDPFSDWRNSILDLANDVFSEFVMSSCFRRCTLLPAERTDVEVFAKELWNTRNASVINFKDAELDGTADFAELRQVGRYSWPIEDSVTTANNLSALAKRQSKFADLATELEALLGGTVQLSDDGEFRFSFKERPETPIGVHLSSSVVKSLVSLVFFFRHRARNGDVLMIDEPESNLHPDNQRRVTRILAKAVNRGLRVIMSTHSDYVLREINNLILLGHDTDAIKLIREKHGYSTTELLAPEKVGPYLFRNGGCESIPVTDDGFEVKTIEDEINRLNEISQDIYAALS